MMQHILKCLSGNRSNPGSRENCLNKIMYTLLPKQSDESLHFALRIALKCQRTARKKSVIIGQPKAMLRESQLRLANSSHCHRHNSREWNSAPTESCIGG